MIVVLYKCKLSSLKISTHYERNSEHICLLFSIAFSEHILKKLLKLFILSTTLKHYSERILKQHFVQNQKKYAFEQASYVYFS